MKQILLKQWVFRAAPQELFRKLTANLL